MKTAKQFLCEFFAVLEANGLPVEEVIIGGYQTLEDSKTLQAELNVESIQAGYGRVVSALRDALGREIMWAMATTEHLNGGEIAASLVDGVHVWQTRYGAECSLKAVAAAFMLGFLSGESEEDQVTEEDPRIIPVESEEAILAIQIGMVCLNDARARVVAKLLLEARGQASFLAHLIKVLISMYGEDRLQTLTPEDVEVAAAVLSRGGVTTTPSGRRFQS